MRSGLWLALLAAGCGAAGSAAGGGANDVLAQAQALSIPLPYRTPDAKVSGWDRSYVDLMVADTWSTCSFLDGSDQPINHVLVQPGDQYLDQLLSSMTRLSTYWVAHQSPDMGTATQAPQKQWISYRNDPAYNRNRATNEGQSASLALRSLKLYTLKMDGVDAHLAAAQAQASQSVALAAMNACIAQGVRSMALGGDILSLSEPEQIQGLEVVRERAQIAMLQYAAILNAIAAAPTFSGTATTYQQMAFLQQWAATAPNRDVIFKSWLSDFASVVQLHLTVTQELSELFVRSAAAKSSRGGQATTAADEEWGAGAWRQRVLALLYGGDPLAVDKDHTPPWPNMLDRQAPGVTLDSNVHDPEPWPTPKQLPYFSVDSKDPHVMQLLSLARRADALRLFNNDDGSANIDVSAEQLYRATEARARTEQCATLTNGACTVYAPSDVPAWASGTIDGYLLFNNFGITPDHARQVVTYLDQYAPSTGVSPVHPVGALTVSNGWRIIPRDTIDVVRLIDEISPLFVRYVPYRIPATVDPNVERTHKETSSAGVDYRIGDDQGLAAGGLYAESMRIYGAMPALSLVRDVLRRVTASTAASHELLNAIATVGPALGATLDAAIGAQVTRLTPLEQVLLYDWPNSGVQGGRSAYERLQMVQVQRSPVSILAGWAVDADYDANNDSFYADASATYDLIAVKNSPDAYALSLSTIGHRFVDGKTFNDLAADTTSGNTVIASAAAANGKLHAEIYLTAETLSKTSTPPTWTFVLRKTLGGNVSYRPLIGAVPLYAWQFNRTASGRASELAPIYSYSFARAGRLGRIATQAWAVQRGNPSRPRYDGFGLPNTWVPVADATAFGSQPGDSVMTYFLRNAKQAALDATDAVRAAINSTQQQQQATLDQQAAQARSGLVIEQEAQRLCGAASQPGGATCPPNIATHDLALQWTPIADAWTGVPDVPIYCDTQLDGDQDPLHNLDCFARRRIIKATQSVPLADPVFAEAARLDVPTFGRFSGGSIQTVLVDQWSALHKVQDDAVQIETSKEATAAKVKTSNHVVNQMKALLAAAQTQLKSYGDNRDLVVKNWEDANAAAIAQCGAALLQIRDASGDDGPACEWTIERIQQDMDYVLPKSSSKGKAGLGGTIVPFQKPGSGPKGGYTCPVQSLGSDKAKLSQLGNMVAACQSARATLDQAWLQMKQWDVMKDVVKLQADADAQQVEAAKGNLIAEGLDGVSNIARIATELDSAAADVSKTVAQIAQLQEEAQLSVARAQLEQNLATQGAQLSLGLYRQYNQYDWWRARALLDGARRYAVAARRAIETAYVTDLNTLTSPEAFVAAPASWAADAYRYDLSLPSAVGLSTGQAISGAQYPNAVLDYVANLERFVQGFAVERPMSAAVDNQMVSIPGPGARLVVGGQIVPDPARAVWSVLCPAGTACASANAPAWCPLVTTVPVAQTCRLSGSTGTPQYVAPAKARVTFYFDPWGRSVGRSALTPLDDRANARWGRLAVNLVGNGIKDCSLSQNPSDCQANQYLFYDLQHQGPSLAFGATREWMELDVPVADIQAGKAASLGEYLDVLQNGWGKPFVEAVARTELIGRPLNGAYNLELSGAPGVLFDNIETVQVLLVQNYSALQF
jgi:hypothetical protein